MAYNIIHKRFNERGTLDHKTYDKNRDKANSEIAKFKREIKRQGYTKYKCQVCGSIKPIEYMNIHHRVRIADGGSPYRDNMMCLCEDCHNKIHIKGVYKPIHLTMEQIIKYVKEENKGTQEIAEELNTSKWLVEKAFREHGITSIFMDVLWKKFD